MADNELRKLVATWLRESLRMSSARRGARWTQSALAAAAGISRATIWSVLQAKADADLSTVQRLAEALGVPEPSFSISRAAGFHEAAPDLRGKDAEAVYLAAMHDIAGWPMIRADYQAASQRAVFWINQLKQAIERDRADVEQALKLEIQALRHELAAKPVAPAPKAAGGRG